VITPAVTWQHEEMERVKDEILAFLEKPRERWDIRFLRGLNQASLHTSQKSYRFAIDLSKI
jgi:hypothetical protein